MFFFVILIIGSAVAGIVAALTMMHSPDMIPWWFGPLEIAVFLLTTLAAAIALDLSVPPGDRTLTRFTHPSGHNHWNPANCPIDCPKNPYY